MNLHAARYRKLAAHDADALKAIRESELVQAATAGVQLQVLSGAGRG